MKNLNFRTIIDNRKLILDTRKVELEKILPSLKLEVPIIFSVSEISKFINPRKKGEKVGVQQLNFLEDIKGPVIYIFEILELESKATLLTQLEAFRSIDNKDEDGMDLRRSTSKIPSGAKTNQTDILYVGSVKKYIHNRIKQHLGLGHRNTFSIQLKHWAPENLKLKFYYIKLNNEDLTYDIEAAIAKVLNPLIGETEK